MVYLLISFYAGGVQLNRSAAEKQFAVWLTTQTNAQGRPYKAYVANRYAACLRTEQRLISKRLIEGAATGHFQPGYLRIEDTCTILRTVV